MRQVFLYGVRMQTQNQPSVKERIIAKFGGVQRLADALGVSRQAVWQWKQIPAKHQGDLLAAARRLGVDLRPDDFFDIPAEDAA